MTHCSQCDGKGFVELRDCSGEIQREETCSFCNGTGLNTAISKLDLTNRDRGLIETYLHRLQWEDIRKRSQDDNEAYDIQNALMRMRGQL